MPDEDKLLPLRQGETGPVLAAADMERMRSYAEGSIAESTKRAYRSAWQVFAQWCEARAYRSLPASPAVVAAFVADQAGQRAVATIGRYLAAIGEAHRIAKLPVPTGTVEVRTVMKGVRRKHGVAQHGKAPLLVSHLRRISEVLPATTLGVRDRALLLVGFAAALRRSELVGLDLGDLDFQEEGLALTLRKSKTDQTGKGRLVGVPYGSHVGTCPVRAARAWLEKSGIVEGPVFRPVTRHGHLGAARLSGQAVGEVVHRSVMLIGLDPAEYGGHSLRAGLATEAARAGAGEVAIMAQTGHRSVNTLRGYIRHGTLFTANAAAMVGL